MAMSFQPQPWRSLRDMNLLIAQRQRFRPLRHTLIQDDSL